MTYWCRNDHVTEIRVALEAEEPPLWDCPRCGLPAGRDAETRPDVRPPEPYKTHLAYVKERRSPAEGEAILAGPWPRYGSAAAGTSRNAFSRRVAGCSTTRIRTGGDRRHPGTVP